MRKVADDALEQEEGGPCGLARANHIGQFAVEIGENPVSNDLSVIG